MLPPAQANTDSNWECPAECALHKARPQQHRPKRKPVPPLPRNTLRRPLKRRLWGSTPKLCGSGGEFPAVAGAVAVAAAVAAIAVAADSAAATTAQQCFHFAAAS
eukprot:365932-Chlamydomonas_euryale.AAC.5